MSDETNTQIKDEEGPSRADLQRYWMRAVDERDAAVARVELLEGALCAARNHDPSCPVKPTEPCDPFVHVDGCDCGAAKTNARIDAALAG